MRTFEYVCILVAGGLAGPLSTKMLAPSISSYRSKLGSLETFIGTNKAYALTKSVQFPCLVHSQKNVKFLSVTCGASSKSTFFFFSAFVI